MSLIKTVYTIRAYDWVVMAYITESFTVDGRMYPSGYYPLSFARMQGVQSCISYLAAVAIRLEMEITASNETYWQRIDIEDFATRIAPTDPWRFLQTQLGITKLQSTDGEHYSPALVLRAGSALPLCNMGEPWKSIGEVALDVERDPFVNPSDQPFMITTQHQVLTSLVDSLATAQYNNEPFTISGSIYIPVMEEENTEPTYMEFYCIDSATSTSLRDSGMRDAIVARLMTNARQYVDMPCLNMTVVETDNGMSLRVQGEAGHPDFRGSHRRERASPHIVNLLNEAATSFAVRNIFVLEEGEGYE